MRDIEFRGKSLDTGKWVYGGLTQVPNIDETYSYAIYERAGIHSSVEENTIGEYTGLTDRSGRRIYEKDIVRTKYGRLCGVSWFSSPSYAGWDLIPLGIADEAPDEYDLYSPENLEVIGNIYDNPELLDP